MVILAVARGFARTDVMPRSYQKKISNLITRPILKIHNELNMFFLLQRLLRETIMFYLWLLGESTFKFYVHSFSSLYALQCIGYYFYIYKLI